MIQILFFGDGAYMHQTVDMQYHFAIWCIRPESVVCYVLIFRFNNFSFAFSLHNRSARISSLAKTKSLLRRNKTYVLQKLKVNPASALSKFISSSIFALHNSIIYRITGRMDSVRSLEN